MRGKLALFFLVTVSLCWAALTGVLANAAGDVPRMTANELKERLGDADVVIVDVRTEGSWKDSESKIKGAVREDPTSPQNWIQKYPRDKTLVLYCS